MFKRRSFLNVAALTVAAFLPAIPAAQAAPDTQGQWNQVSDLPWSPPHVHVLTDGRVLMWPGSDRNGNDPRVWNPANQSISLLSKPGFNIFCAGHTFLDDGTLFVAGGHIKQGEGTATTRIYDPFKDVWLSFPDMNAGRWYPTTTILPNGDVLIVSGKIDNTIGANPLPQVFEKATGTLRDLTNAQLTMLLYPRMLVAPDGRVFHAGPEKVTRFLNTSGTGAWTTGPMRLGPVRTTGSIVMYAPGKIIAMGGGDPPTNTAEVIDLNQPNPTWREVDSMAFARRQMNAVLLPDGKVLVSGGTNKPGFNDATGAVDAAELWDPATEQWSLMASDNPSIPRIYHSATVLLPDGRVLSTGGDGYPQTELYSPPYLFKGTRPTISSAPDNVNHGGSFFLGTADAAAITKIRLIRLSSTTHAFNMSQHPVEPSFSPAAGGFNVTVPNANLAPPGHYWLFVVNGTGVPSVGKLIRIGAGAVPPPPPPGPAISSLSPNSAAVGAPEFTLTVNGTNFVNGVSIVRWNGANRQTSFVTSTQVTAQIPASDISAAGTAQVTVANGVDVSNAAAFTVGSPPGGAPTTTSISPSTVTAGGPGFTLTVNGSNFVTTSVVRWNGANRPTTYVSSTQVTAAIPASDIASAGTKYIRVANGASVSAPALHLKVTTATGGGTPAVTSISPSTVTAGGPGFSLTVNGSNFVTTSVVRVNGVNRSTTYVSPTKVTAAIPASDIASAGIAYIRVANGASVSAPALQLKIKSPP